ncbi:hypothetical protein BDV25DRAFT_72643 [Aspergillus avenaceus]|uniref:Uncharacterized protein n=1 Tax=Aspergillus avenaceus TaxID=36643 RepID=A0A5N6TG44_ASPAV|nr:hypothetical protein BDV25DRAFT_72643 [Aspergillus avenaceus]
MGVGNIIDELPNGIIPHWATSHGSHNSVDRYRKWAYYPASITGAGRRPKDCHLHEKLAVANSGGGSGRSRKHHTHNGKLCSPYILVALVGVMPLMGQNWGGYVLLFSLYLFFFFFSLSILTFFCTGKKS